MIRNIIALILLVGTGGMLLTETIFSLNNQSIIFITLIFGLLFMSGIYYHIKGLDRS